MDLWANRRNGADKKECVIMNWIHLTQNKVTM